MSAVEVVYAVFAGFGIAAFLVGVFALARSHLEPGPSGSVNSDTHDGPSSPVSPKTPEEIRKPVARRSSKKPLGT